MTQHQSVAIPTEWVVVKESQAAKLSGRAQGLLTYRVGYAPDQSEVFVAIVANAGGGYFSKELVPASRIAAKLDELHGGDPFNANVFKPIFVGRSSCNAAFMAAALLDLGLIAKAKEPESRLVVSGDVDAWIADVLAQSGELVQLVKPVPESTGEPGSESAPAKKSKAKQRKEAEADHVGDPQS